MRTLIITITSIFILSIQLIGQVDDDKSIDSIEYSINIKDVVISAQYVPTQAKNSIYQITSISKEEIEQKSFTTLDQVLNQQANVRISYDPILGAKISLRGIGGENIAILQDGVPIVGRLDGNIDLSQINIGNIERIEIIEGPQSAIYGNNAAGGIINIISKKSQVDPINMKVSASQEFPTIQNLAFDAGVHLKKMYLNVGSSYLKDQPYANDSLRVFEEFSFGDGSFIYRKKYPWNPKLQNGIYSGLRYFIDDQNSVSGKWDNSNQKVSNLGELRRPAFKPYAFDENYLTTRNNYSIKYDGQIKGLKLDAVFARNDFFRVLEMQRFEFDTQSINEEQSSRDSFLLTGHFLKLNAVYQFKKLLLSNGFQFNQEIGQGDRIIDLSAQDSTKVTIQEFSVFSDLRYKVNSKLTSSIAGRLNHNSSYGLQLSPSVQNLWKINKDWRLRIGFARGFRSPGLKELFINFIDVNHYVVGNELLQPEKTNNWNLSLIYNKQRTNQKLDASLKLYRSKIKNKIVLAEFEPLKFQYRNVNNFSTHGSSITVKYSLGNWTISNDLNYGYWYNLSSELHDTPKYSTVFDNYASIMFNPKARNHNIQISHRFVGKVPRYTVAENQIVQNITEAYQLLDINTSYKLFNNSLLLNLGIRNLLNISYANINRQDEVANHSSDTISSSQIVARGRSFYIAAQYNFKGGWSK